MNRNESTGSGVSAPRRGSGVRWDHSASAGVVEQSAGIDHGTHIAERLEEIDLAGRLRRDAVGIQIHRHHIAGLEDVAKPVGAFARINFTGGHAVAEEDARAPEIAPTGVPPEVAEQKEKASEISPAVAGQDEVPPFSPRALGTPSADTPPVRPEQRTTAIKKNDISISVTWRHKLGQTLRR